MKENKYKVGDKFIIEIGSVVGNPGAGNREGLYVIKPFDSAVFTESGLDKLQKYDERRISEEYIKGMRDGFQVARDVFKELSESIAINYLHKK